MKTSIRLIQTFSDSNILRHYAVYLKLKHIHTNGVIYKYNISILSQKSALSRNTIRKYVKFFLDEGWCKMRNSNLCFISLSLLRVKYSIILKQTLRVDATGNITKLLNNLRYEILKLKDKQFQFLKEKIKDRLKPTGKDALKKLKAAIRYFKNHCTSTPDKIIDESCLLTISIKKLANLINMSASSAHNIIKQKVLEQKAVVIRFTPECIKASTKAELKPNQYNYKGYIYTPKCNNYMFNL